MPRETKNVFLDTEIFDHQNLDVTSPNFKRMIRLIEAGEVHLIETDVTVSEIRSHLNKFAKTAFKQLSNYKKVNRVVKEFISAEHVKGIEGVTEETVSRRLHEELDKFFKVTGARILSVDGVSPAAIFEKYFQAKPPFNDTNKKVEFPDAFAGAALQSWCESSPKQKLYVVSGDPDWKKLCEEVTAFIHVKQLEGLLEIFADSEVVADLKEAVEGKSKEVLSFLTQQVESGNLYFFVDDSALDGEVDDIEDVDIELQDVHVVEVVNGTASLNVTCMVSVSLFVKADDPDSVYRDPDDGDYRSVWRVGGSVQREIEMDATIDVTFDPENPKDIVIRATSFQEEGVAISIDEGELTRDYDDEDEPEIYGPDEPEASPEEPG